MLTSLQKRKHLYVMVFNITFRENDLQDINICPDTFECMDIERWIMYRVLLSG